MAFDRNNPLYEGDWYDHNLWPKYVINDDEALWPDGTAYILCENDRHAAGYGLDMKVIWEHRDGSFTWDIMNRWSWDRSAVSPLCAMALVMHLNQEKSR